MSLGLPSVSISFEQEGITGIERGKRGVVALILKGTTQSNFTVYDSTDIPEGVSEENIEYINLALQGYTNSPSAIEVFVLETDGEVQNALDYFETMQIDYLTYPGAIEAEVTSIINFVKAQRLAGNKISAVLKTTNADHEGIINFTTDGIVVGTKTYTAMQYSARIAGLLAGCDLRMSTTYAELKEIDDIPFQTKAEVEAAIGQGQLVLFKENKKIKIGRGVTSFITISPTKGVNYKKIKLVAIMDLIANDLTRTCKDVYIGKYENNYDNKCLLVSAISGYLDKLANDNLIEKSSINVGIDIDAQRAYLKGTGINVNTMSEKEIKEANTGDGVFIFASAKLIDSIEEIEIKFTV